MSYADLVSTLGQKISTIQNGTVNDVDIITKIITEAIKIRNRIRQLLNVDALD